MSRTYSNFLLFEDVLDAIPTGGGVARQAVDMLLNPTVKIVEEDCNTYLGKKVDTSMELQGFIEVATKTSINKARVDALLGLGQYKTGVRNLRTCQSYNLGGICKTCYNSEFLGQVSTAKVGSTVKIPALQVYQSDVITGTGYTTTFSLTQNSDEWYDYKVVNNGSVISTGFTIGTNSITFTSAPALGSVRVVHFRKQNSDSFLGWISKTYSGSILGLQPLPSLDTMLRMSLYETMFSDSFLGLVMDQVRAYKAIPSTYMDYLSKIHDKMERLLLALYLYAIYSNVET